MAEDEVKAERKVLLKDVERAKKSLENAIKKGTWPARESQKEYNPREDKEYPTNKEQARVLSSTPFTEETIPPEIKRKLTGEAKRLNTMAMGTQGEGAKKTSEPQKVPPFVEGTFEAPPAPPARTEHIGTDEGVKRFKEILRAGVTPEETLERTPAPPRATEKEPFPVSTSEERLRRQIRTTPQEPPREPFLKRFWNKLRGKA